MSDLDDELSALRHDEGCSAAFGDDLRCRCRLEARRGEAREELAKLRERLARTTALLKRAHPYVGAHPIGWLYASIADGVRAEIAAEIQESR